MQVRTIWQREYHEIAWPKAVALVVLSELLVAPLLLTAFQQMGLLWVARLIGILHRVS
jgi:hypothetical protein